MIDMHALNWDKCVAVREQIKLHENKNQIGGIKLVHKRLKVQFIKKIYTIVLLNILII